LRQRKLWDSVILPKFRSSGLNLDVLKRHAETVAKSMDRRDKELLFTLVERYEEDKKVFDGKLRYAATSTIARFS